MIAFFATLYHFISYKHVLSPVVSLPQYSYGLTLINMYPIARVPSSHDAATVLCGIPYPVH